MSWIADDPPRLHDSWTGDPLHEDPTLAPLVPALRSWAAVPDGRVVTSDALLARVLVHRFGLDVRPVGTEAAGPTLVIPAFVDRGPAAVDAALRCFGRGRAMLPDLVERWRARLWLGGWAEVDAALADLDDRCPPGPLHLLAVRARRPDLLSPPAPRVVLVLRTAQEPVRAVRLVCGRARICGTGSAVDVDAGEQRVVHPSWQAQPGAELALAWRRDGVWVRQAGGDHRFTVWAGADARGERTPLEPGVPVHLGLRGSVTLRRGEQLVARVDLRPEGDATTQAPPPPTEPPIDRSDRRILVDVILSVARSTAPIADALLDLLPRHDADGADVLAMRLGPRPIETLGRWLAAPCNEPLRLALADALASADHPAALRARLPKALRCWIPRLPGNRRDGLRLVVGGPESLRVES